MTTLRDWLDRLEEFDPDDWGEISKLRAMSSEAALDTDLEAGITFRTKADTVDRVAIRLIDESDQAVIELEYDICQVPEKLVLPHLACSAIWLSCLSEFHWIEYS